MSGRSFCSMHLKARFQRLHSKLFVAGITAREHALTNKFSVGAHFIYASWYKKSELGTRAAVFVCFGHLGSMAGGWIQAGLLESLNSKNGLPAWRWIFIIVSVITVPVAIFGMTSPCLDFGSRLTLNSRLGRHSRTSLTSCGVVSHRGRERSCYRASWTAEESNLGQDCFQAGSSQLAILAAANHFHA